MNKIGVGLLGLGVVGGGVASVINRKSDYMQEHLGVSISLESVLVRDRTKIRTINIPDNLYVDTIDDILNNSDIDVVIEVMGGEFPAFDYIMQAINKGKNVITANKELIAKHGPEIFQTARDNNVRVLFEASVAAGTPIVSPLMRDLVANDIRSIKAIINGTTNYMLTEMSKYGYNYEDVLKEAQSLGYAESDPTNDVDGFDAAYKLAILSTIAFRSVVKIEDIYIQGITSLESQDFEYASELGYAIKLIAIATLDKGNIQARVHPILINKNEMLANVDGVLNAVEIETDLTGKILFHGPGAGSMPTTSAIIADLLNISRNLIDGVPFTDPLKLSEKLPVQSINELTSKYYVRIEAKDQSGVIGFITTIFGNYDISIASFIQKESISNQDDAEIVIMTHASRDALMNKAILDIQNLGAVRNINNVIRVMD
jgi:homoserine dehydrogenase